jgi:hypothetical protein
VSGKVAVITGGSQGIGAGLVAGYRGQGWSVVASARTIRSAEDPDVLAVAGDIAEPAAADRIIDAALDRFGRIDTLVNNAGVYISKPFTRYTQPASRTLTARSLRKPASPARRGRAHQPGHRRRAVPQPADRRVALRQDLHQALGQHPAAVAAVPLRRLAVSSYYAERPLVTAPVTTCREWSQRARLRWPHPPSGQLLAAVDAVGRAGPW